MENDVLASEEAAENQRPLPEKNKGIEPRRRARCGDWRRQTMKRRVRRIRKYGNAETNGVINRKILRFRRQFADARNPVLRVVGTYPE